MDTNLSTTDDVYGMLSVTDVKEQIAILYTTSFLQYSPQKRIKDCCGGRDESQKSGFLRRRSNPLELSRTPEAMLCKSLGFKADPRFYPPDKASFR
jgi:hypothetical protein